MKKLLIVVLCLALMSTMLCGCLAKKPEEKKIDQKTPEKIDISNADYININGLDSGDASDELIVQAMGREPDAATVLEDGSDLKLFNDVEWLGILFDQVQYSRTDEHLLVTYCYTLRDDEIMEDALESMHRIVSNEYGAGSQTEGNPPMFYWTSKETGNRIHLYQLTETEIRLQYTFENP